MTGQTLEQRLRAAEEARHGQYDKRTEHIDEQGQGVFINRLILEDSPYLLQHAHNPVNWFPWGPEAFEVAKTEDKPVFLSIGYSTCHWCHVMEVESFDNVEVAKLLNEHFISVKMDREQYPDLDEIYMTGVQLMTGQGGWPMSNFLLPDGRPFFGATYFPPPSFLDLLSKVNEAWQSKREELETSAASIDEAIGRMLVNQDPAKDLPEDLLSRTAQDLLDRQDFSSGGLAGAPKFPQEPLLKFLLDYALRERDQRYLAMVDNALRAMGMGGIYDQVAGGFHRYSVDEQWLVPHFEKMLYNQSQLAELYLDAWLVTGDAFYRRILQQTLDYVLREMQRPEGGFYSATDADSEGEEGTFFVWQRQQLLETLSEAEFALANKVFDISEQGNFEGANILKLKHGLDYLAREAAQETGESEQDFLARLDGLLQRLYEMRLLREPPLRDDKLIVGWNGAMINTLARAAWHCDEDSWLASAELAAKTILDANVDEQGSLQRIALNGTCSIAGQLEDYANLVQGLITLFDVTGKPEYLDKAALLASRVQSEFHDAQQDALYLSPAQQTGPQLVRSTNASDGATLSPIATMLANYLCLAERAELLSDSADYRTLARTILTRQSAAVAEQSISHTSLLRVLQQDQQPLHFGIAYAAQGLLRVRAVAKGKQALVLQMSLQPGWHITAESVDGNSAQNFPQIEVAEQDTVWSIERLTLPDSNATVDLAEDRKVAAYEGDFDCAVQLSATAVNQPFANAVHLRITVQLCTQGRCLLPETLELVARVSGAAD